MQRILVVGAGTLFDDGLCCLLKDDHRLHVSSLVFTDEASFLSAVSSARPNVIVLVDDHAVSAMKVLELLNSASAPIALRIVVVHEDDNAIEIYDRTCVSLTLSNDLFYLIRRGGYFARKQRNDLIGRL